MIHNCETKPHYKEKEEEEEEDDGTTIDMTFCSNYVLRSQQSSRVDVELYVSNRFHAGHLINAQQFDTSHLNNEMYEIKNNRLDWQRRYLHVNYSQNLDPTFNVSMVLSLYNYFYTY